MNRLKFLLIIVCLLVVNNLTNSQNNITNNTCTINVSDKLTTHLIFEDEVEYIDIGAREFSVDILKNIVKIKCTDSQNWNIYEKTNLTVVTKRGDYYSIWVYFDSAPKVKTYWYKSKSALKLKTFDVLDAEKLNTKKCVNLTSKNSNIHKEHTSYHMNYEINGLFYEMDKIIFRLKIENLSRIKFTTDSIRFLLTTKKKFNIFKSLKKFEPIQYIEKKADFVCNEVKDINGKSSHTFLFGFKRFVPTKDEILEIRVSENNSGGRRGVIRLNIKDFLFKDR